MIETILNNLTNVGSAMIIFAMAWASNCLFGLYGNIALEGEKFDWKRFLRSILKVFIFVFGLGFLVTVVTALPIFANQVGWAIPQEYQEAISSLALISVVMIVTVKYVKEAFQKFMEILNYDPDEYDSNYMLDEESAKLVMGFRPGDEGGIE